MKKLFLHILTIFYLTTGLQAQTDTLFWFAVPRITPNHPPPTDHRHPGGKPVYLVIAALGPTKVTIDFPASTSFPSLTHTFTSAGSVRLDLSSYINTANAANSIECYPEDVIQNKGMRIRSDKNFITAYYEVDNYFNRDIFALKGINSLGTSFIVPFQHDSWNNQDGHNGNSPTPNNYNTPYDPPYSTIDIVATENNTLVTIIPSVAIQNHPAGVPFTIILQKGQTYSIRALNRSRDAHMGGTKITSTKKIAVTIKDDSVKKNNSYDLQGDQNIPVNVIGKNYLVMRGRINRASCVNNPIIPEGTPTGEQIYIYGTQPNTQVTINGVIQTPLIGEGQRLIYNIANNATYVSADKPIYVYHVSGIGCETGAAVLPTIDGCTGSKSVPIVRSTDETFILNIMTTTKGKKWIFIKYGTTTIHVPETDFEQVGTTDWWVLKSNAKDYSSLPVGQIITVYSTEQGDRFHLGVMNGGGSSGAKYGYFSDYASDRGSALVVATGSEVYEACYGEPVQLVAKGGLSYKWWLSYSSLGDTTFNYLNDSTLSNPIATPPTGIFKYKVNMKRACYPDTTLEVAVNVLPSLIAMFTTDTAQLCSRPSGNKITFYNTSPNPDTLEFYWDFTGDGIPELSNIRNNNPITWNFPRNNSNSPITYKVTLYAFIRNMSSCISTYSKNITIYPEIDASFTQSVTLGCNPLTVNFTNTSTGHITNAIYTWDFGNGNSSSQMHPTQIFENLYSNISQVFNVRLIATSQYYCRDTATSTVTVHPYIKANFTVDTTRGCADFTVNIRNRSLGAINSYYWDYGDGQTSTRSDADFTKIYTNNTATKIFRNLKLIVSNAAGCRDSLIRTITVLPKVNAVFTTNVTEGCNPLTVNFTGPNNLANVSYLWEFGDNNSSTLRNPTNTFENTTNTVKTFVTKLTVTSEDFCVATFTNNITVREKIEANFSVDKARGCSGFTSRIQNISFGGNAIVNYVWNFGDGSPNQIYTPVTQPPAISKIYENNGNNSVTYNLTLTVNNSYGCISTKTVPITVNPGVAATFTTTATSGCNPHSVTFTNTTDMNKVSNIRWEFGDNTSSTAPVVTHIYSHLQPISQIYTARLIAVSAHTGCIDTTEVPITVFPYIKSNFAIDTAEGCSPLKVNITNLAIGGISQYTYTFGDGNITNSSASNLSYTYVNKTNNPAPQTRILKQIVQNIQGCKDSTQRTIIVKPEALARFSVNKFEDCTPLTVSFTNQSNSISTNFFWEFGDGTSSALRNPTHTFENTTANDKNYQVKLRATTALGCHDDTIVPITAYAYIRAGFSIDDALICSHTPVAIRNLYQGGVAQVMWDMDGNGTTEYNNNSPSFTYPFINNTNTDAYILVKQVVKNNHACYDTFSTLINVKPRVISSFTVNQSAGCNPLTIQFTNTSNIRDNPLTTFLWNFADGGYHTGKNATHTFYNYSGKDSIYPVRLTVTSEYTCSDDTVVNITVYPDVTANFSISTPTACSNEVFTILNSSSPGSTHNYWDFSGTGSQNIEINTRPTFTRTLVNNDPIPKLFNIRLIAKNEHACYDTAYAAITIMPVVIASFVPSVTAGCSPLFVNFTNTSNIKDLNGTLFEWNFGDGGIHTGKDASYEYMNYTGSDVIRNVRLRVTSNYSCTDDTIIPVTVYPYVKANFSLSKLSVCSNEPFTILNNSTPGSTHNYWDFSGTGSQNIEINTRPTFTRTIVNNDAVPKVYNVRLIAKNEHACYDTLYRAITVQPRVISNFSMNVNAGCQPLTVQFTNQSNIANTTGAQFKWNFGNGYEYIGKETTHTYINNTPDDISFPVTLTATSNYQCSHDTTKWVTVYAYVDAKMSIPITSMCANTPVQIFNASSKGVKRSYWLFDNGTPEIENNQSSFNYLYTLHDTVMYPKTFRIRLIATNNHSACRDTDYTHVTIRPLPKVRFTADKTAGCQPLVVNFTNTTNMINIPGTRFEWNFGNGNSSNNINFVSNIFENNTTTDKTFTVKLKAISKDECSDSTTMNITAYSLVDANFALPDNELCSGETIEIDDKARGGIVQKLWDFTSDGIYDRTGNMTNISYSNTTDNTLYYNLKQKVINSQGCADSMTREVIVRPKVIANFTHDTVGCTPFNPKFKNTSSKSASLFEWYFGDGSSSTLQDPVNKEYINNTDVDKVYRVKLISRSEYGCSDSITKTLKVAHRPIARIAVDKIIGCPPLQIDFYNNTKTSGAQYYWNFGEGTTASTYKKQSYRITYDNEPTRKLNKQYVAKLRAVTSYWCEDTTSVTITVYPRVTAQFDTVYPGCHPLSTVIKNTSLNASNYLWNFDDGTLSNQKNPKHLFNNTTNSDKIFNVELKAWSDYGCRDSFFRKVLVYPGPDADFLVEPISQFYPNATFKIKNRTNKGPWIYRWDFGNGDTMLVSDIDTFSYTYQHWGKYVIKLEVTSDHCNDTTLQNIVLYAPLPIADFDSSASGCAPFTVRFKNKTLYANNYHWDFNDGATSTLANPIHTFTEPGEYIVKLTVFGDGGVDKHYEKIKVLPKPIVDFSVEPQIVMIPDDQIKCFNFTRYGHRYIWYFGDGATSEDINPVHYYKNLGNYSIKLVAYSTDGCVDSLERINVVQVLGKGKIEFPNAFTPSMSGPRGGRYDPSSTDNDIFYPIYEGVAQYRLEIYDRWGELLFVSTDVNEGWDGYYKGKLCKQGVYVYKAKGKFYNGKTFVKTGDITLIHRY